MRAQSQDIKLHNIFSLVANEVNLLAALRPELIVFGPLCAYRVV